MTRQTFLLLALFAMVPARAAPPCPAPDWTYSPSRANTSIQFEGTADADGNLYFVEHMPSPSTGIVSSRDLVSISRAGVPRFRVPNILTQTDSDGSSFVLGPAVMGSHVIILRMLMSRQLPTPAIVSLQLTAYEVANGAVAWSTDVLATLRNAAPGVTWTNAARPAAGNFYALVSATGSASGVTRSRLAAFDFTTGAFLGSASAPFGNVVVDTSGDFYVLGGGQAAAFTPSGNDLFRASTSVPAAQAVGEGVLVGGGVFSLPAVWGTGPGLEVLDARTGALLWSNPATFLTPLISRGLVWAVKCANGAVSPMRCPGPIELVGFDLSTGAVAWHTPIASPDVAPAFAISGPVVTSIGPGAALMIVEGTYMNSQASPALLLGIDSHGVQTLSCELPENVLYWQPLSIAGGELVVSTYAAHGPPFSLRGWSTGLALTADGWPTAHGNQAASNRAR